jgi:hypothetical protein
VDRWIANEVAMMSMETNAGLTFMDIAPMLKINELKTFALDNKWMTCGALRRGCYEGAEGMRRFRERVDSCQGGELGNGIVILRV